MIVGLLMAKSFEEIRLLAWSVKNNKEGSLTMLLLAIKELCEENEKLKQKANGFEVLYEEYKDKHFFTVQKNEKIKTENEALKKQLRDINI